MNTGDSSHATTHNAAIGVLITVTRDAAPRAVDDATFGATFGAVYTLTHVAVDDVTHALLAGKPP